MFSSQPFQFAQTFPMKSLLTSTVLEGNFAASRCFTVRVERTEFGFMVGMGPVQRDVRSQLH